MNKEFYKDESKKAVTGFAAIFLGIIALLISSKSSKKSKGKKWGSSIIEDYSSKFSRPK